MQRGAGAGKSKGRGITQRKDGRWQGSVTFGYTLQGKPDRRFVYGHSFDEAYQKRLDLLSRKAQGLPAGASKQATLGQFLDTWLQEVVKPNGSNNTYIAYEVVVRLHLSPGLGHYSLSELEPQQIQSFFRRKVLSGTSTVYIRYMRTVLITALNQAVRWELVSRNVASLTTLPPERATTAQDGDTGKISAMSREQVGMLLQALTGSRHEALFSTLVMLGLRKSEALALTWNDIDFERKRVSISKNIDRRGGVDKVTPLKTKGSRRVLPMPPSLIPILLAHKSRIAFDKKRLGTLWEDNNLVFPNTTGGAQNRALPNNVLRAVLTKAGLPQFTVHALRHTFASSLLSGGVPVHVVAAMLGHADSNVTLRVYAHAIQNDLDSAAEQVERALFGG